MTEQNNQLEHLIVVQAKIAQLRKDYEQLQKEKEKLAQAIDELKHSIRVKTGELASIQTVYTESKKRLNILRENTILKRIILI